ncbi:MAG: DUF4292 domain-containing protein [Balneolales bacterium]|nr:DUF4292 domain-containing protein [Balneolales bacterium]
MRKLVLNKNYAHTGNKPPVTYRSGKDLPTPFFVFSKAFATILCILIITASCSRTTVLTETGDFRASELTPAEIMPLLQPGSIEVNAVEGRASARISGPGVSEQATLLFTSDRNQSLIVLRNNLGMEGGRIYSDGDSVTVLDRIEKTAYRMAREDSGYYLLSGFTAFNVIEFIIPRFDESDVKEILENDDIWRLKLKDRTQLDFKKQNGSLLRLTKFSLDPAAYSEFIFTNHAGIRGVQLPRRIQMLSTDQNSTIFLIIQALEINPSPLNFDINIPSDIPLIRI